MITDQISAQKHKISAGFQSQTQTTSVNSNPLTNITETTESTPPAEVTEISVPKSSTLVRGKVIRVSHENYSNKF